ncbi:MAG: hypothetical protein IKT98_07355 [Selenomonadaceae bacterium]|nr:hypothetical protein [Selenomonadaceae bacterium]
MNTFELIASLFKETGRKPTPSTREVLKELETAKKIPATPPSPVSIKPLKIRSEQDWNDYFKKLSGLDALDKFAEKNSADWKWFVKSLDKVKKDISKMTFNEFDEYTTEAVVTATVGMSKKFIAALDSCGRTIKNPSKDSTAAQELYNLIEKYLLGLGIRSMNFKAGDDFEKWADLELSEPPIIESTFDRRKHNTLKEIYVQPHYIDYIDEHDKKAQRVFGGQCAVYACRG